MLCSVVLLLSHANPAVDVAAIVKNVGKVATAQAGSCVDSNAQCIAWKNMGNCKNEFAQFMHLNCKCACGQTQGLSAATAAAAPAGTPRVKCESTVGEMIIEVHPEWAPLGAQRFLDLVRHRACPIEPIKLL